MNVRLMALLLATSVIAGCGGVNNSSSITSTPTPSTVAPAAPTGAPLRLLTNIAVPNASTPAFGFDIGYVEAGRYYLANRSGAAVDVVDTKTNALLDSIPGGFAGMGATAKVSGPDGIVGVTGTNTLYVGDVDSVKIVDTSALKTVGTVVISNSGSRVDEGCYDPDSHLIMYAGSAVAQPYVVFISTMTQTVVAKLAFNGSKGLEACAYDSASKSFLINNDGTPANPDGELDTITASSVGAGGPAVSKSFPLGKCPPTGIALGPDNDVLVGCDPSPGNPLITEILDRNTGVQQASVPFGGADQVAYDPATKRYFLPAQHFVKSGTSAPSGFSPTMGVIDAATRKLLFTMPVGAGAHSVAVDSTTGQVYIPFQPGAAGFPNGGVSVFSTK